MDVQQWFGIIRARIVRDARMIWDDTGAIMTQNAKITPTDGITAVMA
jgi:hypothetical protein